MHNRERNGEFEILMVIKSARPVVLQIKIPRAVALQPFLGCCRSVFILWRSPWPLCLDPRGRCRTQDGNCTPASAGEKRPRARVAPTWHRQGFTAGFTPFWQSTLSSGIHPPFRSLSHLSAQLPPCLQTSPLPLAYTLRSMRGIQEQKKELPA